IAGFRRDGETRGDGQADFRHLGQTCSLAAEQIAPFAVAFRFSCTKEIDPLFHGTPLLFFHCGYSRATHRTHLGLECIMSARRQFSKENCHKTRHPPLQVKLYIPTYPYSLSYNPKPVIPSARRILRFLCGLSATSVVSLFLLEN